MALGANTIHEVRAAGSDTANGGAFDPGQTAGMFTTGAATSATGNSPVFTDINYNFVAGDVGAYVFIPAGTNWKFGWYKIVSVAANAATLAAAVGEVVKVTSSKPAGLTTAADGAGCATVASPTGATWTIDYSQQDAARNAYTDLASAGAGLTVSSAAKPFGKQMVGNGLIIASGTNFTAGVYVVASVSGVTATVVGPGNITTGVGASGVGGLGGAFATWGKAEAVRVASNGCFIGGNLANIGTGITLAATGNNLPNACPDWTYGYTTTRFDGGIVTITASAAISMVTPSANNCRIENIYLDGADTATTCWAASALSNADRGFVLTNCGATRFATRGAHFASASSGPVLVRFRVWDAKSGATAGITMPGGVLLYPEINTPECDAIAFGTNAATTVIVGGVIYLGNVGATKVGISALDALTTLVVVGVTFHTFTGDCIKINGTYQALVALDNIFYGGGGYGLNGGYARPATLSVDYNAFGTNTSGPRNNFCPGRHDLALTGDPCTNAAAGDLSLDNTAGEGAACRAAGFPGVYPGGTTTGNKDIGGVQHADPVGGGGATPYVIGS